tara:strand:+ start:4181 stop:4360 length:180 start_codon:yes stop_codon:yes gene_type:complete
MPRKKPTQEEWVNNVVEAAEAAVIGYEKYLMDKLSYRDLAVIMKQLRNLLPMDQETKHE